MRKKSKDGLSLSELKNEYQYHLKILLGAKAMQKACHKIENDMYKIVLDISHEIVSIDKKQVGYVRNEFMKTIEGASK